MQFRRNLTEGLEEGCLVDAAIISNVSVLLVGLTVCRSSSTDRLGRRLSC